MKITYLIIGIALCQVISGCAQYQWRKQGSTQLEFNKDNYECQSEAAIIYPTQIVQEQRSSGYTTPSTTNCDGNESTYESAGKAYGNSQINCTTKPGKRVQGVTKTTDVNKRNRNESAKQCMYARGWERIRVQ